MFPFSYRGGCLYKLEANADECNQNRKYEQSGYILLQSTVRKPGYHLFN